MLERFGTDILFLYFRFTIDVSPDEKDPRDADKTTFVIRRGIHRFKVMPVMICSAFATFQRLMNVALAGLAPDTCSVYLDNISVHCRDLELHLAGLERLFEWLRQAGTKLK